MSALTRQLVFNLIFTGAQGRMKAGEVYDIWPFSDRVITNQFRMMNWDPMLQRALANNASEFLKSIRYEKTVRWDRVWAAVQPLLDLNRPLTIILVSNMEKEIRGISFDQSLNEIYRKQLRDARRERVPLVTAFEAHQKRLAAFVVSSPGSAIPFENLDQQISQLIPKSQLIPEPILQEQPSPVLLAAVPPPLESLTNPPPLLEPAQSEPISTNLAHSQSPPVETAHPPSSQDHTNLAVSVEEKTPVIVPSPEPAQILTNTDFTLPRSTNDSPPIIPPSNEATLPPPPETKTEQPSTPHAESYVLQKSDSAPPASATNKETPGLEFSSNPPPVSNISKPLNPQPIQPSPRSLPESFKTPPISTVSSNITHPLGAESDQSLDKPLFPLPKPDFSLTNPATSPHSTRASFGNTWLYLIAGILLLITGMMMVWMMKHKTKPKANPSFISRSIERELR